MRIQINFLTTFVVANFLGLIVHQPVSAKGLKRVDLVVSGSSCASCLTRIEKKLRTTPGVLKAMVSVYRPYPAVVIYNSEMTSLVALKRVLESEKASAEKIVEVQVKEVPVLLLPSSN
jgi:copper chaperone CopZ